MFDLTKGQSIELPYPIHSDVTHVLDSNYQVRNLVVYRLRDLLEEPLTPLEFVRRPYVNRSRWLLRAWDADLQEWRQFYLGTSPKFRAPGSLRLAVYAPEGRRPLKWLGRQFEPTVGDRRTMLRILNQIAAGKIRDVDMESVRIVADDLRLLA